MRTSTLLSALIISGSIAYAGHQLGTVSASVTSEVSSDRMPPLAIDHPGDLREPTMRSALLDECDPTALTWFDPVPRRLLPCTESGIFSLSSTLGSIGAQPLGVADVNGDGVLEHFDILKNVQSGTEFVDSITNISILMLSQIVETGDGTRVRRSSVLDATPQTANAIRSLQPSFQGLSNGQVFPSGWRDIDNDGDMDLICDVRIHPLGQNELIYFHIWFENVGYEHTRGYASDINHDGSVNSQDLVLLLAEWTEN